MAGTLQVVLSGLDTLHMSTDRAILVHSASQLDERKADAAADSQARVMWEAGGQRLRVQPYGTRRGPYLLESDFFAVSVNPRAQPPFPTAGVELRAQALWSLGYARAAEVAAEIVADLTDGIVAPLDVSRVDLTADFQGWSPAEPDLARVTTKARTNASYRRNAGFTGFMFGGGGPIAARLYDKRVEAALSGKGYFEKLWRGCYGYDAQAPVWRLEFQLRREALRDFEDAQHVDCSRWQDCMPRLGNLWRYLAGRWLTFREKRTAQTRQVLTPEWAALVSQPVFIGDNREGALFRTGLKHKHATTTMPALCGYLARGMAESAFLDGRMRLEDDTEAELIAVLRSALSFSRERGLDIGQRAQGFLDQMHETERAGR